MSLPTGPGKGYWAALSNKVSRSLPSETDKQTDGLTDRQKQNVARSAEYLVVPGKIA